MKPTATKRIIGSATRVLSLVLLATLMISMATEETSAQTGEAVRLWANDAPGALGEKPQDIPTLTPYLVEAPRRNESKTAIVIFPGGGYGGLAGHEGHDYAQWFNQQGISAFVLKYRLGSKGYRHPVMLQDASRAVRMVRKNAGEWGIDPQRVGVIGSSAGGHLASTLVTHFDSGNAQADDPVERHSSRPDFGILCYPVVTMGPGTHGGSKANLLGKSPDPSLVWLLSNEKQVTPQTPPCFVWHTAEDQAVLVQNSLAFAAALADAGVPFDLHVFQKGHHGIGLQDKFPFDNAHPWAADLRFWLRENAWLK